MSCTEHAVPLNRFIYFPKQRLRGGVLTLNVHKLAVRTGFPVAGGRSLAVAGGFGGRWPVAVAVAGSFGRRWPAVAVAGALWCRCGSYG